MFIKTVALRADESLSSWRWRLSQLNSYGSLRRQQLGGRWTDPDFLPNEAHLNWAAEISGVPRSELQRHDLASVGQQLGIGKAIDGGWLLQCRYSKKELAFGPMYCPRCLREDKTSYFRATWRLAFHVDCPVHRVAMREACPNCGRGVWPVGARDAPTSGHDGRGLRRCNFCFQDLAGDGVPSDPIVTKMLLAAMDSGTVRISAKTVISTTDYFQVLYCLAQLQVRTGGVEPGAVHEITAPPKRFSAMDIEGRRRLLTSSVHLLADWPSNFLAFASAHDVSWVSFDGWRAHGPEWLRATLDKHLRRQRRGVTVEQVRGAVLAMKASGAKVTKAGIAEALGSYGNAVETVLARRHDAEESELRVVLSAIGGRSAAMGPWRRLLTARNELMFLTALNHQKPFSRVAKMTLREVADGQMASAGSSSLLCAELRTLHERCVLDYSCAARQVLGLAESDRPLHVARGGSAARRAQIWLSRAMRPCDLRLMRSVGTFSSLIK